MSSSHLIDHLDAAIKLAELHHQPLVAYLIKIARDAALKDDTERHRIA